MTSDDTRAPLELKFDPNTIDDLGAKLYSTLPPILAELIANGYDAGADKIYVELNDIDQHNKTIIIKDNGNGMSYEEINSNYLFVGRKKREQSETHDPIFKRPVMGKKGIGKLSFFGITDFAEIITIQNGKKINFEMDRIKIRNDKVYRPNFEELNSVEMNGTTIILSKIKRESAFDFAKLKDSIANYFIFDKDFHVFIKHNDGEYEEITNDTRFQQLDVQFTWEFPNDKYPYPQNIKGKIFTAALPISKRLRGIALISRKKLVNLPELFPSDTSSYFYEYLTGYLEIDFVDDLPEDVISTDRKTLNWGNPALVDLEKWLNNLTKGIESEWRPMRKSEVLKNIEAHPSIKKKKSTIRTKEGEDDFEKTLDSLAGADINEESAIKVINEIKENYPDFHNKNLCPELASLTLPFYESGDYYDAVFNGVKRYIVKIRTKISKHDDNDEQVVIAAFKEVGAALDIVKKYEQYKNVTTGAKITTETKKTLSRGNLLLAQAMLASFRNPLGHQEKEDLKESEIYTAEDCLDALGLLSHLFRRLDSSELS